MGAERCTPFRENLAAFAIGALDVDETTALKEHLQSCADCQRELTEYRSLSLGLLEAVPPRQPPARLRRQLVRSIRPTPNLFKPGWQISTGQIALGVVFIALLVANFYTLAALRIVERQQTALAAQLQTGQTAMAMLAYPSTESLPVEGDNLAGSLLLDRERNVAALILWNLPDLPTNRTYQIWLVNAQGQRTSAGLFQPTPGQLYTTVPFQISGAVGDYVGIGVTDEPAGGSPGPTGSRVLKVDF